MNKKEINRYTLGIVVGVETRHVSNNYELTELYNNISKYNSNVKNPFFLGKPKVDGSGVVEFKKYKKITEPSTLEKIDILTTMYKSDPELKKALKINTNNTHRLEILYRYNKDIRTLPIVYKEDKSYINRNFLKDYINSPFLVTPEILTDILDSERVSAACRTNIEDFDALFPLREKLIYNPNADTTAFNKFYFSFITQGGKFNYYNFRLMGILLMEYEKRMLALKPKEEPEQLVMKEIELMEEREKYEEAKLKLTNY